MDLEYPKHLHKLHNDYPLAPEKLSVKEEWLSFYQTDLLENKSMLNCSKLVPNLMNKEKYVNEKPYIRLNTELRKKAKSAFEKDFYKLMNNSVFGKTTENLHK